MRDEDYVEHLFVSHNHDYLLFFTDHGQCYWLRVYEIPEGGRTAKGRSIRNLIQIPPDDCLRAVLNISKTDFEDEVFLNSHYVLMATRRGQVKKTLLEAFSRPRVDGIIAISIDEDDELLEAHMTDGEAHVLLGASNGKSIRFRESDVRPMGRNTRGVKGITLAANEHTVGMIVIRKDEGDVLAVSANGYGKRTHIADYRLQSRGGKGIITLKTTSKTGPLVTIKAVREEDDLMISTVNGIMIRFNISGVRAMGRNTQGVRVINLKSDDEIADVTRVVLDEDDVAEGDDETPEAETD
jgi:DNA gyrase subunit A